MKRIWSCLLTCALLLTAGCSSSGVLPEAREVENITLMRTMGVDVARDGGVKVTVSSGAQSKGSNQGSEPPVVLSQEAGTVSAACLAIQGEGNSHIFYGHVDQLLVGEEQARQGLSEALGYVERDIEMRLDTEAYVVKGVSAAEAIEGAAGKDKAAVDRLEALEQDAGILPASTPRSVKQIQESLDRCGAAFLPALVSVEQEDGKRELESAGYAIIKDNVLVDWAEGDAARGLNLLLGKAEADIVELDAGEGKAALRLVGERTLIKPVMDGDRLTALEIDCAVEANVAQCPEGLDLSSQEDLSWLQDVLAETCEFRLRSALALSQSLDADFMDLGSKAALAAPWKSKDLQAQWAEVFAALPINIKVEANIQRSYDIKG